MLLFQKKFHGPLKDGSVTLTFRRWDKARVKAGGKYRCHPIGVLEVSDVRQVKAQAITTADAKRAGFATRAELLEYLSSGPKGPLAAGEQIFRVELRYTGDGDHVPLALSTELSAEEVEAIERKLARLDRDAPWTYATLELIAENPRVVARVLAQKVGRERDPFKVDVRKLKRLGLTQSFEIGYELSPRGRAFLEARGARNQKPTKTKQAKRTKKT